MTTQTPPNAPVRCVLVIEDDFAVRDRIERALDGRGIPCICVVNGREALENARSTSFALMLLDFALPDMTANDLIEAMEAENRALPFIIMTARGSERVAVDMMKRGAEDYLVKDATFFDVLPRAIDRALAKAEQAWRLAHVKRDLSKVEQQLDALLRTAPNGIYITDASGSILLANDRAHELAGCDDGALIGRPFLAVVANEQAQEIAALLATDDPGTSKASERQRRILASLVTRDGQDVPVELSIGRTSIDGGVFLFITARDLRETQRLEESLRQAQKMEAIGQLAGGVAHDFNNLVTAILSFSEFALESLEPNHPARDDLKEISDAGRRAQTLTRQLLAFSRKQLLRLEPLDLNELVRGVIKLLSRIVGETVNFKLDLDPSVGAVVADRGQLEQVLTNLAINARDAMPRGGSVVVSTRHVPSTEAERVEDSNGDPVHFVELAMRDSGAGMSKEVLTRIFDPFFTTKGQAGTGLGLSTVYGIVKQLGGSIRAESVVGKGTAFRVQIRSTGAKPKDRESAPSIRSLDGATKTATILLVEDEPAVRAVARRTLEGAGHKVVEAKSAGEALVLAESHGESIDLLLTDVVMPIMSGPELARKLLAVTPIDRVLFMTGYADDSAGIPMSRLARQDVLMKPFTREELLARVARSLKRSSHPPIDDSGDDARAQRPRTPLDS